MSEESRYVFDCMSQFTREGLRTTCNINPAVLEALGLTKTQPVRPTEETAQAKEEEE